MSLVAGCCDFVLLQRFWVGARTSLSSPLFLVGMRWTSLVCKRQLWRCQNFDQYYDLSLIFYTGSPLTVRIHSGTLCPNVGKILATCLGPGKATPHINLSEDIYLGFNVPCWEQRELLQEVQHIKSGALLRWKTAGRSRTTLTSWSGRRDVRHAVADGADLSELSHDAGTMSELHKAWELYNWNEWIWMEIGSSMVQVCPVFLRTWSRSPSTLPAPSCTRSLVVILEFGDPRTELQMRRSRGSESASSWFCWDTRIGCSYCV
jgi:hypothetical protein